MNDVRGDAARAARNSVTSHAAPFGTRPGIDPRRRHQPRVLVRGFLCERNVEVPVQAEHAPQLLKAAGIRGGCIIDG